MHDWKKPFGRVKKDAKDINHLQLDHVAAAFAQSVVDNVTNQDTDTAEFCSKVTCAMHESAQKHLPDLPCMPKKPWLSRQSLVLVDQRNLARHRGDYEKERELTVQLE